VIQTSFYRALESGFRLRDFFDQLAAARDAGEIRVPLVAMVSYSIVHRLGHAEFLDRARVDGLIVPDLSVEEADELAQLGRARGCPLILIAGPTTDERRRARIAALSGPFVYYQSIAGVTGERLGLPADLASNVASLRAASGRPVCVGFGLSRPEDVRAACRVADGAIVGSALVRRMTEAIDNGVPRAAQIESIVGYIEELAEAAGQGATAG
jgi:tryptophan synthase alpha chain